MSEDKWNIFAATGKISDYLSFKGISYDKNGDTNADANTNSDAQGTGYTGISYRG